MVELFKEPKIDWIENKRIFIYVTIILLLVGAVSVMLRGFQLGVDFTGGTIVNVRFEEPRSPDAIRAVLGEGGVDTSKVIIQPVTNRPNELLIRAPQITGTESEQRVDADKRLIIRALQKLNPAGDVAAGRVNINNLNAAGVEQELFQADPLGIRGQPSGGDKHPYQLVAEQVIAFRDGQPNGFLTDINALRSLTLQVNAPNFDAEKVKAALLERLYAGPIDLNLASGREIEDALNRTDPLGLRAQGTAGETYQKAAEAIKKYRADRQGVIGSVEEIQTADVSANLLEKMKPFFTTGSWSVVSADVVGPQVGQELRNRAIYVTLAALAGMLIYLAFRFEWIYGVAAVLAVFHDVLITLGFFSIFGWQIDLTVIAALLTLVGYSMNDTIVIFDRIRENLRFRRREPLAQLTNDAINQTLSRTIITSGLTFLSVLAIVLFGGEVLRGFGLALTIGIIIGTYSSIAVASPVMLWWEYITQRKPGGKASEAGGRAPQRTLAKA